MDVVTSKRMEQKQLKEMETDYGILLTEFNYGNQLRISWLDIINYVSEKMSRGACRSRVKELFLQEVVDPKLIDVNLKEMEIDIDMQNEAEKYNYNAK